MLQNCRLLKLARTFWAWFTSKPAPVDIRWSTEKGQVLSKAGTPYHVIVQPGDGEWQGNETPQDRVLVFIPCNENRWLRMTTFEQIAATAEPQDVPGAITALVEEADRCVAAARAAYEHGWRPA